MKILNSPRQPLVAMALAAIGGISLAEFFRAPLPLLWLFLAIGAIANLIRPRAALTLLLVVATFFTLHLLQLTNAPGKELRARLGVAGRQAVEAQSWESVIEKFERDLLEEAGTGHEHAVGSPALAQP